MKTSNLLFAMLAIVSVQSSSAIAQEYTDTARVVSATPKIERFNAPRQECHTENKRVYDQPAAAERGYMGPIIGGVVGGLLGSQVGGGSGKKVAGVAGAIGGTLIGDHVQNNQTQKTQPQGRDESTEVCRSIDRYEERTVGYDVRYSYNGRNYNTVMQNRPGTRIPVRIDVTPVIER